MWDEINQIIDEYVQPVFKAHGGYVEPIDYTDDVLRIVMKGRCSNCPSAAQETEDIVKKELKDRIPEIKDVILVSEVSEELMEFAKSLLKRPEERK